MASAGRGKRPLVERVQPARRPVPGSARSDAGEDARAASTNVGSFSSVSACCGVLATVRAAMHSSRRGVEVGQHRVQERALPVHVNAAAVLPLVGVGDVVAVGELEVRVVAGRLVGLDARAADLEVEQPGDRQGVVADELGLEPPRGLRGEQPVVGVDLAQLRAEAGVLAVGRATSR